MHFKNKIQHIWFVCALATFLAGTSIQIGITSAQTIPDDVPFYEAGRMPTETPGNKIEIGNTLHDSLYPTQTNQANPSLISRILGFFGLGNYSTADQPALSYVRLLINWLLGLVSLIALIVTISAFYLIFFWKGEEGLTKAKKNAHRRCNSFSCYGTLTIYSKLLIGYLLYPNSINKDIA